jgi:hypothetical protein
MFIWGNLVTEVIGCGLDKGLIFNKGKDFSLHHHIQTISGACPVVTGYKELMCPGHEADYTPSSLPEVQNARSFAFMTTICFNAMVFMPCGNFTNNFFIPLQNVLNLRRY